MEGEMIMISSVIAAHHNYLNLWIVVAIGLIGTYCSDLFYFNLGRTKGKAWLEKKPSWQRKAEIIDSKLKKYPILIFLIYRFMYGFRTITPFVIGTSMTKTAKFYFYSAASTILWAVTYCSIGYTFGSIIKSKLSHIEHLEKYIIGATAIIGLIFIVGRKLRKKRAALMRLRDLKARRQENSTTV